ncbi:MAG: hypothetical protein U5J96_01480 [Ignavibacteriaceae bacterium]|nr:hypothetical protein [Ignavibacteriaceae bacterium]
MFTIRSLLNSTIEILTPNGGEELTPEIYFNITWKSINVINVKIELSINNGASWIVLVDSCPKLWII